MRPPPSPMMLTVMPAGLWGANGPTWPTVVAVKLSSVLLAALVLAVLRGWETEAPCVQGPVTTFWKPTTVYWELPLKGTCDQPMSG